jgi:hypothetical protein
VRKGNLVNRQTREIQDVRTHGRPSSKWRESVWREPAFGTGNARGMTFRITNYELRITNYGLGITNYELRMKKEDRK